MVPSRWTGDFRDGRQLLMAVHPGQFDRVAGHSSDLVSGRSQDADHVGQVVLALGILSGEPLEGRLQMASVENVYPSIDLVDGRLSGIGVPDLNDLDDISRFTTDDPTKVAVLDLGRQHRGGGSTSLVGLQQSRYRLVGQQRHVARQNQD